MRRPAQLRPWDATSLRRLQQPAAGQPGSTRRVGGRRAPGAVLSQQSTGASLIYLELKIKNNYNCFFLLSRPLSSASTPGSRGAAARGARDAHDEGDVGGGGAQPGRHRQVRRAVRHPFSGPHAGRAPPSPRTSDPPPPPPTQSASLPLPLRLDRRFRIPRASKSRRTGSSTSRFAPKGISTSTTTTPTRTSASPSARLGRKPAPWHPRPSLSTAGGCHVARGPSLPQALSEALGDRKGIRRFGDFCAPLDEALVSPLACPRPPAWRPRAARPAL